MQVHTHHFPPTTRLAFFFADIPVSSGEETDGLIESDTDDGSLYVPIPQRMVRENAHNYKIFQQMLCASWT